MSARQTLLMTAGVLLSLASNGQTLDKGQIPAAVMKALSGRFANPQIDKVARETEAGVVFYDIEFRQAGRKFEADIAADGTILNWEKAVSVNALPAAVRRAVAARYPKAVIREAMALTDVRAGKDIPAGFEVTMETTDKKAVELTVAVDGTILEDGKPH